jgi:protein tyrosine phosphatase (PTP) superfamily phosphohydrolase (DUF442 family)
VTPHTARRVLFSVRRRAIVAAALIAVAVVLYVGLPYLLRTGEREPPLNTVVVNDRLATSGQPSAAQLRGLRAQGYQAVINLAPADSYGSVSDEADIVRRQGLDYYHVPVRWEQPSPADFARFRAVVNGLRGRRTWVHCQMNMRASVFVFLHRVIDQRVLPKEAIGPVHAVWVPNATWREFAQAMLSHHGVAFDPDLLR